MAETDWTAAELAALDRVTKYNVGDYDATTNPYGFGEDGYLFNQMPQADDGGIIARGVQRIAIWIKGLADAVAGDRIQTGKDRTAAAGSAEAAAGSAGTAKTDADRAAAAAAGVNLPGISAADAGKAIVVGPDGRYRVDTSTPADASVTRPKIAAAAYASQAEALAGAVNEGIVTPLRAAQAARKHAMATGTILYSVASLGADWLRCDGKVYLRSAYPDLAAKIGAPPNKFDEVPQPIFHRTGSMPSPVLGSLRKAGNHYYLSGDVNSSSAFLATTSLATGFGTFLAYPLVYDPDVSQTTFTYIATRLDSNGFFGVRAVNGAASSVTIANITSGSSGWVLSVEENVWIIGVGSTQRVDFYKSTNDGRNWTAAGSFTFSENTDIRGGAAAVIDGSVISAHGGGAIYKSPRANISGSTFVRKRAPDTANGSRFLNTFPTGRPFSFAGKIYVRYSNSVFLSSSDGGETWQEASFPYSGAVGVNNGVLIIMTSVGVYYLSTDGVNFERREYQISLGGTGFPNSGMVEGGIATYQPANFSPSVLEIAGITYNTATEFPVPNMPMIAGEAAYVRI